MTILLKPEEIKLTDLDGKELTYIIHRVPAVASRELITQYPTTAIPKIGNYEDNQSLMIKLMGYVQRVDDQGNKIRLESQAYIDNHVPDGETLLRLEAAMLDYNTNFLKIGRISKSLNGFTANIKQWVTKTLTQSAQLSKQKSKQRSKN